MRSGLRWGRGRYVDLRLLFILPGIDDILPSGLCRYVALHCTDIHICLQVGFVNPTLYAHPEVLNDIVNGSNPNCGSSGFETAPGWDPVS